uniref:Uncharacterized protein n=1 Tax=Heterorhabditis bacteriophora TaxID=37862 RepID=A0A1I7WW97_HETBA
MARTKPTSTAKRTKTASELPRPREIIPKGGKEKKAVKKNIAPTKKHTTRTKKTLEVKPKETESRNEMAEQTSSQMDIRKLATDTLNAQVDSLILSLDKFQAAMNENDQSGNEISLRNDLLLYLIERHGFSIKERKMKRNVCFKYYFYYIICLRCTDFFQFSSNMFLVVSF